MSWLELDDRILEHPKFIRAIKLAGSEVVHLWLGIRAYCGQNLTDGFVPADMLDEVRGPAPGKKRDAALAALLAVKLLDQADGGVMMHDYLDWSSSREDVLKRREQARERKQRSRGSSGGTDTGQPQVSQRDGHRDVARTDSGRRAESQTPARAFSTPLHSPPQPDQTTAAADPRPVSLPRAEEPPRAAAAAPSEKPAQSAEPPSGKHPKAQPKPDARPRNLEEALLLPVCERAVLVVRDQYGAQFLQPERWPEVIAVEAALAEGEGRKALPLTRYHTDAGVRAVVELYAAGFVPGDVKRVARQLPSEPWWREGDRKRGLASLSPEVMRRGLAVGADVGARELLARADASRLRRGDGPDASSTPLGDLLGKVAGGAP